MEGVGIPIYISCQKALLQEWGSHNNMYKTFLNRTKDILKCVKDKTNSMHFSQTKTSLDFRKQIKAIILCVYSKIPCQYLQL